jgi:crotonobetainyl-CoA:carnitine CoA-transferase CaiB-like acyl-CoA transferase
MSLDLNKPKGREVAKRLIQWADVVTESFRPGQMKKWGLDYETVRSIKPDIIYYSTNMQGQYGPHIMFGAYGAQLTCLSGFSWLTGSQNREPVVLWGAYTDWVSYPHLVIAIVGALARRRKAGKGMYLDQSQYESGVTFLAQAILDYDVNKRVAARQENREINAVPHNVYPCKGENRWVVIAVFNDAEWEAFCRTIGNPDWISKFSTFSSRKKNEDELNELIAQWTIQHTPEEVMSRMQENGVAAGVVQSSGDLFNDPQLKHREHYVYIEHSVIGSHAYPNESIKFSKSPPVFWKAGPCLGEDNEYVYREILGFSDDEISDLMAEGVITFEDVEITTSAL